jgi:predicted metal-binding protein
MKYDTDQLIQEAVEVGFSQAGELNTQALVFMPEGRELCAADRCGQYGKNWRCPPGCGSIEDAAAEAARYSYGIIVQTIGLMEDDFDYETIKDTGEKHKGNFTSLVDKLRARYSDMLPLGAGTCSLCETCAYPDAPCRFPDKSISSMEAYGLWVSKVCELSGVPYNNGKGTITYTSCYLLK